MITRYWDWERALHTFNLKILPTEVGKKPPAFNLKHASKDRYAILKLMPDWNEKDYGLVNDGSIVVMDIDSLNRTAGLKELEDVDISIETFAVNTPNGGLHLYYRNSSSVELDEKLNGLKHINLKSTPGSYIIGPGSTNYNVVNDVPMLKL